MSLANLYVQKMSKVDMADLVEERKYCRTVQETPPIVLTSQSLSELLARKKAKREFIIKALLPGVPFSQRRVLVLRYFRGWEMEEIAKRMAITEEEAEFALQGATMRIWFNYEEYDIATSSTVPVLGEEVQ